MKKSYVIVLLILSQHFAFSQGKSEYSDFNIPTKDGQPFYELIDSTAKSKAEIYVAARKTFSDLFKNSKNVIQSEDKDAGQITGKGSMSLKHKIQLGVNTETDVRFSINVQVKDYKYRVQIYDFFVKGEETDRIRRSAREWRNKFFPAFHEAMQALLIDFIKGTQSNMSATEF